MESTIRAKDMEYEIHLNTLEKHYKDDVEELAKTNEQLKVR